MHDVGANAANDPGMQGLLATLAEPTRFGIIELLRDGPRSVGSIAEALNLRQPQTSKHLRVLLEAGLVTASVNGNQRIYALRPDPFRSLDDWLATFREKLQQRYDRLEDYLQAMQDQTN